MCFGKTKHDLRTCGMCGTAEKERERDVYGLLLDAAARPIDRAGDVRLDSGALTTHADLKPQVVLRVHVCSS